MKKHTPRLIAYMVVALVILAGTAFIPHWLPEQVSSQAEGVDQLSLVLMLMCVVIFAIVLGAMTYSLLHFRAKPGQQGDGAPIHGHHRLEVVWTVIPFIIVTAISVYSYMILSDNEEIAQAKGGPLQVHVHAFQFGWNFDYPQEGVVGSTTLVLPKDRQVQFTIDSKDVIHDFWVPEARLKEDAVPGKPTHVTWTPNRLVKTSDPSDQSEGDGIYVVCAELCGGGHSTMRAGLGVVTPSEFDAWVADQKKDKDAAASGEDDAAMATTSDDEKQG